MKCRRIVARAAMVGGLAAFFQTQANAQPADRAPVRLTLQRAIRLAARQAPDTLVSQRASQVSEAETDLARAAYFPLLEMEVGATAFDPLRPRELPATYSVHKRLQASWTAVDFGQRAGRLDAAKQAAQADKHDSQAARVRAAQSAAELFVGLVANQALVEQARQALGRRIQQQSMVTTLVEGGARPSVELEQANLERLRAEQHHADLVLQQREQQAALAEATGLPLDTNIAAVSAPLAPLASEPLPSALATAMRRRPEILAANARIRQAQSTHRASTAALYPQLAVAGSLSHEHLGTFDEAAPSTAQAQGSILLRWNGLNAEPWYRRGVDQQRVALAEAQRDAVRSHIEAEVTRTYWIKEQACGQIPRAQAISKAASDAVDQQHQRYASGMVSLLELMDALDRQDDAEVTRIRAALGCQIAQTNLRLVQKTLP